MGNKHQVYGWTFGRPWGLDDEPEVWYYKTLYDGNSLLAALWTALGSRGSYGCVKIKIR